MHISKNDESATPPTVVKSIGKRLELKQRVDQWPGIAPSTVAFIVIATAVIAFMAGIKADDFKLIGNALDNRSSSANQELPADIDYSTVEKVYDKLKTTFDGELDYTTILVGLKKGLAGATGDPYTTYLSPEQAAEFTDDLNGTFSGIGAEIGEKGEFIIIVAPLDGYPADTAGLQPGDIILRIDEDDATGLSVEEAVLKIRGEEGTKVILTILRDGQQTDVEVIRESITIPSVVAEVVDNVGVLSISRFADDTFRLARAAALDFIDQNVDGVVVDLRNNSGGYLSSAIDVSGIWLDSEVVTEQRENDGQVTTESYNASDGTILGNVLTVVLINEGSASASEIVTGALKDHGYATIMGVTSYGKGSVQNLEELEDGGVLKVTVARWYTPNGDNIDQQGIEPDISVEAESDDGSADKQLQAAIDYILDN